LAQKKNKSKVEEHANDEIFDILDKLPEKTYHKITDVEIEVGKLI
jgi:predicted HAD superfamily hydrolase